MPCILHWDIKHFVVLEKIAGRRYVISDPAKGRLHLTLEQVSNHFTGVALELYPDLEFSSTQISRRVSVLRKLANGVPGIRKSLLYVVICALGAELLTVLLPLFVRVIFDRVLSTSDVDFLKMLGIGFIIIIISHAFINLMRGLILSNLTTIINLTWTLSLFRHLMALPEEFYKRRTLGDVSSKFGSLSKIQQTISSKFISAILDSIFSIITLTVIFYFSPIISYIAISFSAVYLIAQTVNFRSLQFENWSYTDAASRQSSKLYEAIRGSQTIKLNNLKGVISKFYMHDLTKAASLSAGLQNSELYFRVFGEGLTNLERVAILWVGATYVVAGDLSAGALMASLMYCSQFSARAHRLVDYSIEVKLLRAHSDRVADIIDSRPEPGHDTEYFGKIETSDIEFRNVFFRYSPSDPWVLNGASFKIKHGESVALTGPSGSGKSTIAKLITGLHDPSSGSIHIGGVDIRHLGKKELRSLVASVMQDDTLFAGTLFENISLFEDSATPSNVEMAANLASIDKDIMKMPLAYNTLVGDMGTIFSGGQRQRLLLARAIYRQPSILVLDEATSHLDSTIERAINEGIRALKCTKISIAHRRETIESADRQLFLSRGVVKDVKGYKDASIVY
jgi:ATP-binding cassette subfamily B protein RaxB